ncbi:hypothetical protein QFC21_001056 [Naganishia friedmannii]|uniref:Uncharacterized protein n=1 Tax=Naganishia friedmannii TaxID=89922 RepID=A0ACC2WAH5_9TREE|nr:hypothetical protein QFC21_001056 [Naganishia friedmannii]
MNLGRYTVSTPANPAYASVSFTESVPALPLLKIAGKNPSGQVKSSASRKGKEKETFKPASSLPEPVTNDQERRKQRRRNGTFVVAGEEGFEVWSNQRQLRLLLRRNLAGSISMAHSLPLTPLFILVGGGRNPVFPPNKVVIWLESMASSQEDGLRTGRGRAVASIEYGEKVLRIISRCHGFVVILSHSCHYYEYGMRKINTASHDIPDIDDQSRVNGNGKGTLQSGFWLEKRAEWQTCLNEKGLGALSVELGTDVLAIPGRQTGHIQLIQLRPCQESPLQPESQHPPLPPNFRTPIIVAHTHALSALSCTGDGKYIVTASDRGTLLRVWNTRTGSMERELRRGLDRADIWGATMAYEPLPAGGQELVLACWSDKGTIHVWRDVLGVKRTADEGKAQLGESNPLKPSLRALLDPYMSKSRYYTSTPSDVLFRLPQLERSSKEVIKEYSGSSGDRPSRDELRLSEMYQVAWIERESESEPAASVAPAPPPSEPQKKRTHFAATTRKPAGSPRDDSSTTTTSITGNLRLATHQLIVITHTGDWFRLGVPDGQADPPSGEIMADSEGEDGDAKDYTTIRPTSRATDRADRCKVLEYRRLRTLSAEW